MKRRPSSREAIIFFVVWIAFFTFWTVAWWKQSGESLVRDGNNQWRQVTDQQKTTKKILGVVFGVSFVVIGIVSLKREFNSAHVQKHVLEVVGEKFEVVYELSDDQIVEIGPMHGLNGHALAVAFCYECDWKPLLKSFKFYRFAPPLTYVSYHVQLLNGQAEIWWDSTFAHEAKNDEGEKMEPLWKEELLPVLHSNDGCFLRVHPIFDRQSLAQFDQSAVAKRLTIRLQIKVAACVSPEQKLQAADVSLSQAHAIVHRVLDS